MSPVIAPAVDLEVMLKAVASERRLQHGDPIEHGACNQFIGEKLEVSQPACSRHLKVLADAGLVIPTARKGWVYYRRNEDAIADLTRRLANDL